MLADDFKGRSRNTVKEHTTLCMSGNDNIQDDMRYHPAAWGVMEGGITPIAQPIDAILGEILKGNYRD